MNLTIENINEVTVVSLHTDVLDANNAKDFKKEVTPTLEQANNVVFEMSEVKFVDSSGCGTLLSCLRQLKSANGELKLCGVHKTVRTLFELIRIHRIIEIYDTKEEAAHSF
jgi:anti-sigma B factor antagonist